MYVNSNAVAVIDDDEISLLLIKRFLEQKITQNVLPFSNGLEALNYFEKNASQTTQLPAVILLDITMPLMSGWQFLNELSKIEFADGYKPVICIISAYVTIDFEKLRNYSFIKGYLTKPVIPKKLIAMIESVATNLKAANTVEVI